MHHLWHNETPNHFRTRVYRPDLDYVSAKLENCPQPRAYDSIPIMSASPPSFRTPLYPDPMNPVQFFRVWALEKGRSVHLRDPSVDHRQTIEEPSYWKCEADFFTRIYKKRLGGAFSAQYWRPKAAFYASLCETEFPDVEARQDIDEKEYWELENQHFDDLIEKMPIPGYPSPSKNSHPHLFIPSRFFEATASSTVIDSTAQPAIDRQPTKREAPRRSARLVNQRRPTLSRVAKVRRRTGTTRVSETPKTRLRSAAATASG